MSFIGTYYQSRQEFQQYTAAISIEHIESLSTSVVYVLSYDKNGQHATISKLDVSGNFLWSKSLNYECDGVVGLKIWEQNGATKIFAITKNIPVNDPTNSSFQFVLMTNDTVDSIKKISIGESFLGAERYYFSHNDNSIVLGYNSTILRVNLSGTTTQKFNLSTGQILALTCTEDGGVVSFLNIGSSFALIVKLDSSFVKEEEYRIEYDLNNMLSGNPFQAAAQSSIIVPIDIAFKKVGNDSLYFFTSASNPNSSRLELTSMRTDGIAKVRSKNTVSIAGPYQEHLSNNIALSNSGLYLGLGKYGVMKFDYSLNLLWQKYIEGYDKIRRLFHNSITNQLTCFYVDSKGNFNYNHKAFLLDPDFNSCRTLLMDGNSVDPSNLNIVNSAFITINTDLGINVNYLKNSYSTTTFNSFLNCSDDGACEKPDLDTNSVIQSKHLYLQAAGSNGDDGSLSGIHTRWAFTSVLGENHLPKGNESNTTHHFNKQNDFVRLYRIGYNDNSKALSFFRPPNTIDSQKRSWVYSLNNHTIKTGFDDSEQYDNALLSVPDPEQNHIQFLQEYGNAPITVNTNDFFFAVTLKVVGIDNNSEVKVETLSAKETHQASRRRITNRKSYIGAEAQSIRLVCENGVSLRYRLKNCYVVSLIFEFYDDFVEQANKNCSWNYLGEFALDLDDSDVFSRLEPSSGLIDGNWPKFNGSSKVKVQNYKDKWNVEEGDDKNIKKIVEDYIGLSDASNNPKGVEQVVIPYPLPDDPANTDIFEISHLDLINMLSFDFHIARMLGLGYMDYGNATQTGEFIYLVEYVSTGNLQDGFGRRAVTHLHLSLPTSKDTQRLPSPISIKELSPGIDSSNSVNFDLENGYTPAGTSRYVSIYHEGIGEDPAITPSFFSDAVTFSKADQTDVIYLGLEHKLSPESNWRQPELSHDPEYLGFGDITFETLPIQLPEENRPFFIDRQVENGTHLYSAYSINWFSRASSLSAAKSIYTEFNINNLRPPSNLSCLHIITETPEMMTTQDEQTRLRNIPDGEDKTLVRLSFEYNSQEINNYSIDPESTLSDEDIENSQTLIFDDNYEVFPNYFEIFFRNSTPENVAGKVTSIQDHGSNPLLSVIETEDYFMPSIQETLSPHIEGNESNFTGGIFSIGQQKYIIEDAENVTNGVRFIVYKGVSGSNTPIIPESTNGLISPTIENDGLFLAIENMLNTGSWGPLQNPHDFKIEIPNWEIHREVITKYVENEPPQRFLEKSRGIWGGAKIERVLEDFQPSPPTDENPNPPVVSEHRGLYKITFNDTTFSEHVQQNDVTNSVEWYRGIVRVHINEQTDTSRKTLQVIKIENLDTPDPLVLYVEDSTFSDEGFFEEIEVGMNVSVNFYPGFRVHLYKNSKIGLLENQITPSAGEGTKENIFSLRSVYSSPINNQTNYKTSSLCQPSLLVTQEIIVPLQPEQPKGALFSTRPDSFGRATYTFTTKYQQTPHSVLFYRANEDSILHALYKVSTVKEIKNQLETQGGYQDEYLKNRWDDFFNFEKLRVDGLYKTYPENVSEDEPSYHFPLPNHPRFILAVNNFIQFHNENFLTQGQPPFPLITEESVTSLNQIIIPDYYGSANHLLLLNFIRQTIFNAFVPLTKVPILYKYINGSEYTPVPSPQKIRDKNGYLLDPTDEESGFEMAPMAKIISDKEVQFTDFTLDGTSRSLYFYASREMGTQMKLGVFSEVLGPVRLVNSNALEAPEVIKVIPKQDNLALGITPSVKFKINAYSKEFKIKKINLYRTDSRVNAESIRFMNLVASIEISDDIATDSTWTIEDQFNDLGEIPYRELLFYRLTALKEIIYNDITSEATQEIIEYAPSKATKIFASTIQEVYSPISPELLYDAEDDTNGELRTVVISWPKTGYNHSYSLYKLNNQGNWQKIYEVRSNENMIEVPLSETSLASDNLPLYSEDGSVLYHHFKVIAKNNSGMFSQQEHILTVSSESSINDLGIGQMVIGSTFIVR